MESRHQEITKTFDEFMSGVRVMMLIDRGVQNSNKGSRRWINKLVSTNYDGFCTNLHKLLDMQYHLNNPNIRLYSCVNDRKMDRAIIHFNHKQLDARLASGEEEFIFYSRINDKFCSSLMQPENKASNYFLLDVDCDGCDFFEMALSKVLIPIMLKYKTPNGWHLITRAFNPLLFDGYENIEIKRDALLLLNSLELNPL